MIINQYLYFAPTLNHCWPFRHNYLRRCYLVLSIYFQNDKKYVWSCLELQPWPRCTIFSHFFAVRAEFLVQSSRIIASGKSQESLHYPGAHFFKLLSIVPDSKSKSREQTVTFNILWIKLLFQFIRATFCFALTSIIVIHSIFPVKKMNALKFYSQKMSPKIENNF